MEDLRPLSYLLIVDYDLRLREEAGETVCEAKLLGGLARVVRSARTPTVENRAL
ncbi:MAG TPA: hypothetical protein VJU77_11700 [Chthoniobacterales bacterium]|nr:hypothetical protein [Chthoniobacterales bacterium]